MSLEWFSLFFAMFTGVAGYLGRMFYDRKKELKAKATETRREIYRDFINIIVDQLHDPGMEGLNERMIEFQKTYMLFASPDVINALGEYQQYVMHQDIHNPNLNLQYSKQARVIYEMREDLGLSVSNLGAQGEILFKGILSNYSQVFPDSKAVYED